MKQGRPLAAPIPSPDCAGYWLRPKRQFTSSM